MRPIWIVRVCGLAFIGALVTLIVASSFQESLTDGLRAIWSRRWGVTTLIDLYAGLLFVALWIGMLEHRWTRTLAWAAGLMLLGNLAMCVYVVVRSWRCDSVRELVLGSRGQAPICAAEPHPPLASSACRQ